MTVEAHSHALLGIVVVCSFAVSKLFQKVPIVLIAGIKFALIVAV